MKRVSFVAMIALALMASPRAIAQQAQGSQGQPTLCRDSEGKGYSQGAMTRGTDGGLLRCASGRWEPVPAGPATTTAQSGQGSTQGQGRGAGSAPQPSRAALGRSEPTAVNVRLDLTISDQSGSSQPVLKTISMLLADWGQGRVRSSGTASDGEGIPRYQVNLNADAEVRMVNDDRVRATITIEYTTTPSTAADATLARRVAPPPSLNETVTVLLTDGKATVITQSADPTSDRKVTVSATATIVR